MIGDSMFIAARARTPRVCACKITIRSDGTTKDSADAGLAREIAG